MVIVEIVVLIVKSGCGDGFIGYGVIGWLLGLESGILFGELGFYLGYSFLNCVKDWDGGVVRVVEVGKEVLLDVDNSVFVRKVGFGDLLWDFRFLD